MARAVLQRYDATNFDDSRPCYYGEALGALELTANVHGTTCPGHVVKLPTDIAVHPGAQRWLDPM